MPWQLNYMLTKHVEKKIILEEKKKPIENIVEFIFAFMNDFMYLLIIEKFTICMYK